METPTSPTLSQLPTMGAAQSIERILLTTTFKKGEYTAHCIVDGQSLQTAPKHAPYAATNHLISVVTDMKQKKGQTRDVDYIFTAPVKS